MKRTLFICRDSYEDVPFNVCTQEPQRQDFFNEKEEVIGMSFVNKGSAVSMTPKEISKLCPKLCDMQEGEVREIEINVKR